MKTLQTMKAVFMALLFLSLLSSELANAEFFLQAELGASQVDDAIPIDILDTRIDANATAMRIAAGYQFTPHISAESGYVQFGRYTGILATDKWYAQADGHDLVLTARIPAGERLALEAFGGYLWWTGDVGFGGSVGDTSGNDALFGIGARYNLSERFDIGMRFARYQLDDLEIRYGSATLRLYF